MKTPRALALLICPALTLASGLLSSHLTALADHGPALAFAWGTGSALLSLALAASDDGGDRRRAILGGVAVLALGVAAALSFAGSPGLGAVVLVNFALVSGAHALGATIGRRVAHAGHLLPACAVAAAADLASVIHPSGPSHAIAASESALSLLAIAAPLPGVPAVAPVLGVGDLMFLALVLGAAVAHGVSVARVSAAAAVGIAVAGGLAGALAREVPALVPIGVAMAVGVPAFRRVRPEDRRTTNLAILASVAVAIGVLVRLR